MEAFNEGQPFFRGTTVGEVLDANNEDLKVFVEKFKKEYRKQWQSTASAILKSVGICGSVIDILQVKDVCQLEDCTSPVRKKQKSNDYDKCSTRLLPAAHSTNEPPKINHGLSDEELARIHKLKRVQLMEEIEDMGGEYHKNWSKGSLIEALLATYAMFNAPLHQLDGCSIIPSTEIKAESTIEKDVPEIKSTVKKTAVAKKKQNVIADIEMANSAPSIAAVSAAPGKKIQKTDHKSQVARPIADTHIKENGWNDLTVSKKSISFSMIEEDKRTMQSISHDIDDCMSVSLIDDAPPKKLSPPIVPGVSNMDVDDSSTINDMLPSTCTESFRDNIIESAKENISQTQPSQFKQNAAVKYFTPSLSQVPGSDVKPPRTSPSVPVGIVDSAKKQLLSSQKKAQSLKSQHLARSIVAQKLDLEQKEGNFTLEASLSNRSMVMQPFDSIKAPLTANSGFSEKVKASTEARNERIAQVKALSQKTIPKTIPMTTTSASSGAKFVNMQLKQLSSSKLDPKDRFDEIRAKHQNQKNVEQEFQSFSKPTSIKDNKHALPNPVATLKGVSPKEHEQLPTFLAPPLKGEFVSYEMTDGEYDSDDDDASAARASKRIPDWARSANLTKALEVQYSKNFSIDPDELFGEVETCNLEAIFGLTYPKFRRRNSSGDWTKHRVTSEEKRMYKRHIENS